jgi:hypothetical protein
MSSVRQTASAARSSPEAVLAGLAAVPSGLNPVDTMLVVVGLGIFAVLIILVTCL